MTIIQFVQSLMDYGTTGKIFTLFVLCTLLIYSLTRVIYWLPEAFNPKSKRKDNPIRALLSYALCIFLMMIFLGITQNFEMSLIIPIVQFFIAASYFEIKEGKSKKLWVPILILSFASLLYLLSVTYFRWYNKSHLWLVGINFSASHYYLHKSTYYAIMRRQTNKRT